MSGKAKSKVRPFGSRSIVRWPLEQARVLARIARRRWVGPERMRGV